jgi:GNAT superfamily N-acetyltransferase
MSIRLPYLSHVAIILCCNLSCLNIQGLLWVYTKFKFPKKSIGEAHMDTEYTIIYRDKPEWGIIGPGISQYNTQQAGADKGKNLCFVIQGPDDVIVGGIIGATYWDWLYVDLMWIQEEFRGQGYGSRLLALAEDEARKRGAKNAYLDTFSFQAPEFYKKFGYEVFGELQDFPTGHQRYFLTKSL